MMFKKNLIIKVVLIIILVVTIFNFVMMKINIAVKEDEIEQVEDMIKKQMLKNNEYTDILSTENTEDFYKSVAEDSLGYGLYNEKIYVDITGY